MATSKSGTTAKQSSTLRKSSSNNLPKTQKSILGFFQKKSTPSAGFGGQGTTTTLPIGSPKKKFVQQAPSRVSQILTPAPSSDVVEEEEDEDIVPTRPRKRGIGLPSPVTPAGLDGSHEDGLPALGSSSPLRKVRQLTSYPEVANSLGQTRKSVSYAESSNDDDDGVEDDPSESAPQPRKRLLKRRKTTEESEDNFSDGEAAESEEVDEGL